jgi:hypothetical protein
MRPSHRVCTPVLYSRPLQNVYRTQINMLGVSFRARARGAHLCDARADKWRAVPPSQLHQLDLRFVSLDVLQVGDHPVLVKVFVVDDDGEPLS